jgi:septum formation protein
LSKEFILASNSPRRRELLKLLDIHFTVLASDICEEIKKDLSNEEIVMDLALQKAKQISVLHPNKYILGFDTLVILDGIPLGKPVDEKDAFRMLRALSGKTHTVLTGCAIVKDSFEELFYDYANVDFAEMTDEEIHQYIESKEPFDKAGAYGIQGIGAKFIKRIEGDYYSVMGMPIHKLYHKIKNL